MATLDAEVGDHARGHALAGVAVAGFTLGLPSAINLGFFANQDFVWGVALMISGAFVAFAVMRAGASRFRAQTIDALEGDWNAGRPWDVAITYVVPALAIILLVWWLWQSATIYAPERWFDPLDPFSVMTCVAQWAVAIALFLAINRWLARRTLGSDTP